MELVYSIIHTHTSSMDQRTYQNWKKIKETFEKSGNTDNHFYKRACEVVKTGSDPMQKFFGDSNFK